MNDHLTDAFGPIVSEEGTPAPDQSLWPIEDLDPDNLKELIADIYLVWPKNERIDFGGGVSVITVESVNRLGKKFLMGLMGKQWRSKTKERVELVWAQVQRVVQEQSSLFQ